MGPSEAPRGASLGSRAVGSRGLAPSNALRGLFERERKLLGLLPRWALHAVRLLYQEYGAGMRLRTTRGGFGRFVGVDVSATAPAHG